MRNTKSFFLSIKVLALIALYCLISAKVKAQMPATTEPVYIQCEYMKVAPGMWNDITKGMSKEDLSIADNTGKTRD